MPSGRNRKTRKRPCKKGNLLKWRLRNLQIRKSRSDCRRKVRIRWIRSRFEARLLSYRILQAMLTMEAKIGQFPKQRTGNCPYWGRAISAFAGFVSALRGSG